MGVKSRKGTMYGVYILQIMGNGALINRSQFTGLHLTPRAMIVAQTTSIGLTAEQRRQARLPRTTRWVSTPGNEWIHVTRTWGNPAKSRHRLQCYNESNEQKWTIKNAMCNKGMQ